jgi:hypothetical protein
VYGILIFDVTPIYFNHILPLKVAQLSLLKSHGVFPCELKSESPSQVYNVTLSYIYKTMYSENNDKSDMIMM